LLDKGGQRQTQYRPGLGKRACTEATTIPPVPPAEDDVDIYHHEDGYSRYVSCKPFAHAVYTPYRKNSQWCINKPSFPETEQPLDDGRGCPDKTFVYIAIVDPFVGYVFPICYLQCCNTGKDKAGACYMPQVA